MATSYFMWGVLIQIQSKTGKKIRNVDLSNDNEVLFHPGTSLVFW